MRRKVFASVIFLSLIFSVGCVRQPLTDIDSFIENFNEISEIKIEKSELCGFSENGKISHCFTVGDTFVSLNTDIENMQISSVDAVIEKEPNEEFKSVVRLILKSLTTLSDNDINDSVEKLIKFDENFSRTSSQTHEYTLSFICADAGSKFTLSFNRLVPTQTTNIPVTQREFEEYSTIAETTG